MSPPLLLPSEPKALLSSGMLLDPSSFILSSALGSAAEEASRAANGLRSEEGPTQGSSLRVLCRRSGVRPVVPRTSRVHALGLPLGLVLPAADEDGGLGMTHQQRGASGKEVRLAER